MIPLKIIIIMVFFEKQKFYIARNINLQTFHILSKGLIFKKMACLFRIEAYKHRLQITLGQKRSIDLNYNDKENV